MLIVFSRKQNYLVILFLVACSFFLSLSNAFAGGIAHHHVISSPFDKQDRGHALHCDLSKHLLKQFNCPHQDTGNIQVKLVIASYCGGKTAETIPASSSSSSSNSLFNISACSLSFYSSYKLIPLLIHDTYLLLPASLDNPPPII